MLQERCVRLDVAEILNGEAPGALIWPGATASKDESSLGNRPRPCLVHLSKRRACPPRHDMELSTNIVRCNRRVHGQVHRQKAKLSCLPSPVPLATTPVM